jgi:hypothetical protein
LSKQQSFIQSSEIQHPNVQAISRATIKTSGFVADQISDRALGTSLARTSQIRLQEKPPTIDAA